MGELAGKLPLAEIVLNPHFSSHASDVECERGRTTADLMRRLLGCRLVDVDDRLLCTYRATPDDVGPARRS
jgi:hypothetical protein